LLFDYRNLIAYFDAGLISIKYLVVLLRSILVFHLGAGFAL